MSRGKSVVKKLLDASQAALFAGIEIHNKPHIEYRYQTSTILIVNAWELLLKAYVYKFINKKAIFEADKKHTISFSKALVLTRDDINTKIKGNIYKSVFENVDKINEYRCTNVHFASDDLDPVIFMLLSKSVLNFNRFLKEFFQKDITKDDNLIILPIGFKLPFDPVDYLQRKYKKTNNDFVNGVIETIRSLNQQNIQESIVVGFNVYAESVKKVTNADLVAAIDQKNGSVALTKQYRLTNDPNAPEVRLNDTTLPLSYNDVGNLVKQKRPDIKHGKLYNQVMSIIKKDKTMCQTRYLDPKRQKGTKKDWYAESVVDFLIQKYDELNK